MKPRGPDLDRAMYKSSPSRTVGTETSELKRSWRTLPVFDSEIRSIRDTGMLQSTASMVAVPEIIIDLKTISKTSIMKHIIRPHGSLLDSLSHALRSSSKDLDEAG